MDREVSESAILFPSVAHSGDLLTMRKLFTLLLFSTMAQAGELTGTVVNVSAGDTVTLLTENKLQHRIRIGGIDAPEKAQPFGNRSKINLEQLTKGKDILAACPKVDRYGRKVCKVWVESSDCPTCGKTIDVGYAQISAGLAWWYRAYASEQSAEDRGRYESEENEARLQKRGLWVESSAMPPWEWRRQRK